ncbi:CLUMA_CG004477, isoform A, partial [Clunio marinus]
MYTHDTNHSSRMDISSPTPSDQQYSLKWNDFQSSILTSFRHLRDEEDFVDVTLACDQRSFTAHKQNQSSTSIPWDLIADDSSQPTPPPQKRIKSAELYKKQHGLTDDQLIVRDHVSIHQHALRRERDKSKDSRERDRSLEMKESLLSQALEGGPTLTIPTQHSDLQSLQAQSTGEDSNSSDTVASDAGDGAMDGLNGSLDHSRTPSFANSFLGLQNLPGLLPGPSGMPDNFDAQQHCVAVIKQEVHDIDGDDDDDDGDVDDNEMPHEKSVSISSPSNATKSVVAHESAGLPSAVTTLQQTQKSFKERFRQQQEEIVNRLHKAVTDNLKLMNQGTESCNGNGFANKQDDLCSNRNLNMNLSANSSRFAVRNYNGSTSEVKTCRLNKSKISNAMSVVQQLHSNVPNDLFSSLIDNDDNNNNNSNNNLLHDDNNSDSNYLLPCPLCEIPLEPRVFRQHLDRHYPRDSPICPVLQCGRRFAHPNSVRNHMRLKHTIQWNRMKSMRSSGVSRRSLEMRVRATDPRPCPKCGKIYRSAHTLRTHLEDKHTICPGYRCVLCGTVAKSRNSLHSHMSRQHRGISTKDLPVLPMPSPFDPELASKLLAKAGVSISAAELRARASPTGSRRSDMKLEMRSGEDSDLDDPEDLTMAHGLGNSGSNKFNTGFSSNPFNHPNTTITRVRQDAQKMLESQKDNAMQHSAATGSAILDTYLQFITENTFGMGMTQEQAAAAIHAAKMAQKMAMERNFDKLPPGFFPPHLDISKITNQDSNSKNLNLPNVTIEPTSNNSGHKSLNLSGNSGLDIRRSEHSERDDQ